MSCAKRALTETAHVRREAPKKFLDGREAPHDWAWWGHGPGTEGICSFITENEPTPLKYSNFFLKARFARAHRAVATTLYYLAPWSSETLRLCEVPCDAKPHLAVT